MTHSRRPERGMTLIEVLVALAILGLVTASVLALISQSTRFAVSAEERLLASIAADNLVVEKLARISPLERGADTGVIEIAGRSYVYGTTVIETGVDQIVRVEVAVRDADGAQELARIITLKGEG